MAALFYSKIDMSYLEQQLKILREKYAFYFKEIEKKYTLKWNVEKDDNSYSKAQSTMASSILENDELKIWFFLNHIEVELNSKHDITNYIFFEKLALLYLEFILLHELKHLNQFCSGLTVAKYKEASATYADNPYEKEANDFALAIIRADSEGNYELLQYILNRGKIDIYNQNEWIQKIN